MADGPEEWRTFGVYAGLSGNAASACPYRRPDKRAHWMQGLAEGLAERDARQAAHHRAERDPASQLLGHVALAHLRDLLTR